MDDHGDHNENPNMMDEEVDGEDVNDAPLGMEEDEDHDDHEDHDEEEDDEDED